MKKALLTITLLLLATSAFASDDCRADGDTKETREIARTLCAKTDASLVLVNVKIGKTIDTLRFKIYMVFSLDVLQRIEDDETVLQGYTNIFKAIDPSTPFTASLSAVNGQNMVAFARFKAGGPLLLNVNNRTTIVK
jgi:hypothetical protein